MKMHVSAFWFTILEPLGFYILFVLILTLTIKNHNAGQSFNLPFILQWLEIPVAQRNTTSQENAFEVEGKTII